MSGVLLVDDAYGFDDLIRAVLRGVDVTQAKTLVEAVASARESRPAVVLLDLSLGDEDGIQLLDRFAGEPDLEGVPVVVFSVHDSRFPEAMEKGAVDCLRKPFRTRELKRVVEPFLAEGIGQPR